VSLAAPPRGRLSTALLAFIAYAATLTASPGRIPADTKLYLYLDPGRLIRDAPFSWDTRQFGGWVPHQAISYLWPSGPWFWMMERVSVPDWVAHRLWIGTILLAAGLGVRWAARLLGLDRSGAMAAALVYMLSPYVLPYISRTSVMLLPWAAVGWLVALVVLIAREGRWRDVGWFALVVATVGGVNVTATAMIVPAPLLWLIHAGVTRSLPWRRIGLALAKLGGASLAVSLWWIAMISTQGKYGAAVLGYSETLEAVSTTATAPEVLRGMGYWLFYVRDQAGPTTSASTPYLQSPALIAVGLALLLLCVLGLVLVHWSQRAYASAVVLVGVLLAVGVHPIADASPLTSPLAEASRSTLALALRSSTRAVALSNFGLALGAGALVSAIGLTSLRWRAVAAPVVGCLAIVNVPALFTGRLVDPLLLHDQDPPAAWLQAAAALDSGSLDHRVLQLPGTESQAFTWGYTVDPPLPGLTDKQLVTRDWLPLGSPAAMDLLYAFDDRFQTGTADPVAVAPLARLMGVDTIWLSGDADAQRFGSATADSVREVLADAPDVGAPEPFGDVEVELYRIVDPQPITRATAHVVLLSGSGDGVVDAAAAGVLDGTEAIVYTADLADSQLRSLLADGVPLIVTDGNRDRAHQWRGSQHVWGFTEEGGDLPGVLRRDEQDQRLPVFATDEPDSQTIATLDGGITVRATSYGDPVTLLPQYRPAMAVDGDPSTAWKVGIRGNPVGERIEVSATGGSLSLRQPDGAASGARITQVRVRALSVAAGSDAVVIELDDRSFVGDGQPVVVPAGVPIAIEITAVGGVAENPDQGVGFADLGIGPHPETVRVPVDGLAAATSSTPLTVVLTRIRDADATSTIADVEPSLRRSVRFAQEMLLHPVVTVRATGASTIDAGCRDDLLTIDGTEVPLSVDAESARVLTAGGSADLASCDAVAYPAAAGDHTIASARAAADVVVDRVVLRNAAALAAAAGNTAVAPMGADVTVGRSRSTREITVAPCPTGCWLILGEGASPGWEATIDGVAAGGPSVVSGFAAWRIPPSNQPTEVTVRWTPQRLVTLALLLSAIAVGACLVLVVRDRRVTPNVPANPPRLVGYGLQRASWQAATVAATIALVVAGLAVSPGSALWLLPAAIVITLLRRPALWRWLGLVLMIRLVVGMLRIATGVTLAPGFSWPLQFEQWHRLSVVAVVVLFAGSLVSGCGEALTIAVAEPSGDLPLPSP
jgi:arabinofuranan 3-O-arabinosyltransferase